jgi:NAD(P)H-dependent FMN reductase
VQILGVSGSLREASSNTRLLVAAMSLAPQGVDMRVSSSVATLPLFSPDLELSCSASVDVWVQEMRRADGLVISTPEYAGGYPGALKNALDWLVATDAFVNKPFMLLNASARSLNAQRTLVKVLETIEGPLRRRDHGGRVRSALQRELCDQARHAHSGQERLRTNTARRTARLGDSLGMTV